MPIEIAVEGKSYTETEILLAAREERCIILPVAPGTPVCVIYSNQHDGYSIGYEGFRYELRNQWNDTVFLHFSDALARKTYLSKESGFTV